MDQLHASQRGSCRGPSPRGWPGLPGTGRRRRTDFCERDCARSRLAHAAHRRRASAAGDESQHRGHLDRCRAADVGGHSARALGRTPAGARSKVPFPFHPGEIRVHDVDPAGTSAHEGERAEAAMADQEVKQYRSRKGSAVAGLVRSLHAPKQLELRALDRLRRNLAVAAHPRGTLGVQSHRCPVIRGRRNCGQQGCGDGNRKGCIS